MSDVGTDFDALMRANGALYRALLAVGESVADAAGQTHARSTCLQQIADEPRTVAAIAVRLGTARQSVQRVADLLVSDGLAEYTHNPHHRRAQLLTLTTGGREALTLMRRAHQGWVRHAATLLEDLDLPEVTARLEAVLEAVRRIEIPD